MTPLFAFWLGLLGGAIAANLGIYTAGKLLDRRKRAHTLQLLEAMKRHPAGGEPPRSRYYPPCGHVVLAADPYELVIHSIEHREHCAQDSRP